MELNIEIVAGIYPAVTLQELEVVKNSLLVLVVVSVVMEQCLKMECVLIEAPAQVTSKYDKYIYISICIFLNVCIGPTYVCNYVCYSLRATY